MPTRRRFLTLLAAAPALTLAPRVARAGGAKVLMVGSSMIGGGFGIYLGQDLEREHGCVIDRRGRASTGLARPDFFNWVEGGAQACEQFGPDLVVVLFGGNDGQGLYMGRKANPEWIRWGEPDWIPEYRRRVNAFADAIAPPDKVRRLIWLGMPQVKSAKLLERVAAMNEVFESEMALRGHGRFVPTWSAMTVDGAYSDHLLVDGQRTRVRTGDGVHVTPTGAHLLADFVRPAIERELT